MEAVKTLINGKWEIYLPEHRACRPHWGEWTNAEGETYFGWEVERLKRMEFEIDPGDIVFDIGAELGDLSALTASWGARMVLFEPNPKSWPSVRLTWEANALPKPLATYVGFAGDVTTSLVDFSDRDPTDLIWPMCSRDEIDPAHGFFNLSERPDVPAITIDDFVNRSGIVPDFLNIDVEGSEFHVLLGAQETFKHHKPSVFLSVHEAFMFAQYDESPIKILNLMERYGYSREFLDYDHELHVFFWCD